MTIEINRGITEYQPTKKTNIFFDKATQTPSYDKYILSNNLGEGCYGKVYKIKYDNIEGISKTDQFVIKFFKTNKSSPDYENDSQLIELHFSFAVQDIPHTPRIIFSNIKTQNPYIITPYYGNPLSSLLGQCQINIIQKITKHLLDALFALKQNHIIHGDINPKNICFDGAETTLIDFGCSTHFENANEHQTITTKEYRAPEVIIHKNQSYAIDIWSLGCTLFELFTGEYLFNPSKENPKTVLRSITNVLGSPPLNFFSNYNGTEFNDLDIATFYDLTNQEELEDLFYKKANEKQLLESKTKIDQLYDLISKMITYENRITVERALKHPFLQ